MKSTNIAGAIATALLSAVAFGGGMGSLKYRSGFANAFGGNHDAKARLRPKAPHWGIARGRRGKGLNCRRVVGA